MRYKQADLLLVVKSRPLKNKCLQDFCRLRLLKTRQGAMGSGVDALKNKAG